MVHATYTQEEINEILQLFDQHDAISRKIRDRLSRAAFKDLGEPEQEPEPHGYKIRLTEADIQQMNIPWFVKGMQPAEKGAPFAFTFATERDGTPKPELQPQYEVSASFYQMIRDHRSQQPAHEVPLRYPMQYPAPGIR